jgi:cellulose synthase/poly-beta-1,6-N-acetylglucosamine synthase-like glycosyltransferase
MTPNLPSSADHNSDMPSILCVIPTHNRDVMLSEALGSVLAQSSPVSRVVVVDDLGRSETREMVDKITNDSGIGVSYVAGDNGDRKSAGASRNAGALGSTEEFVAFLDDDDLWDPSFISDVLEKFRVYSELTMVVSWTSMVRGAYRGEGLRLPENVDAATALGRNPGLTGSNFVIRREAFEGLGGFDENLTVANDKDFFIRFLDSGLSYAVVAKELVLQRAHDEGQLTSRTERRAAGLERFQEKYESRLSNSDRREMRRVIHGIRRHTTPSWPTKVFHLAAQILADSPKRILPALLARASGRPTIYK